MDIGAHQQSPAFAVPNIIIKPPVFLTEDVAVTDYGDVVEFRIGNSTLLFKYEEALKISQIIRVHAKRAKARCGDKSRTWSAIGVLDGLRQ